MDLETVVYDVEQNGIEGLFGRANTGSALIDSLIAKAEMSAEDLVQAIVDEAEEAGIDCSELRETYWI